MKPIIIIGYSGHAYVVIDIFKSQKGKIAGYCDRQEKPKNPFELKYLGSENDSLFSSWVEEKDWFVAIGDNKIRKAIFNNIAVKGIKDPAIARHSSACIGSCVKISKGAMIAANVSINSMATIGRGAIINTGSVIEHECVIEDFVHVAPGAILTGNVSVGENSFVGASAVIRQGLKIGKNVTIGAGAVVLNDIPDNSIVYGNPGRLKN